MPDITQLRNYPDINFFNTSVQDLLSAAISAFEETYFSETGQNITIEPGDDRYVLLYAQALRDYSFLQSANYAIKQNFLKYSTGDNLENLAANTGCERSDPAAAVVTMQFSLGKAQTITITIPHSTRVTPGNSLYFATDAEVQIPAGNTAVSVTATCLTTGAVGNGYIPGQISTIVDPVPFVSSVTNTDTSEGGSDTESDDSLAEKVFDSPEGFSVAGPSGAYEYFARKYSSSIIDAHAYSPSDATVKMKVLLTDGTLPQAAFLNELAKYIGSDTKRPLTDKFTVEAPDEINYDINLTYYINASDAGDVESIKIAVQSAVDNYVLWQKGAIGRDIVPDKLVADIIGAGAKRVSITSPVFTQVAETAVAIASSSQTVTYGGTE